MCQKTQDRFERQSVAPDECMRVKGAIGQLEYELSGLEGGGRESPDLRVDLLIVADSKTVHQATYWPSTGFGLTSNFKRQSNGHLEDNSTVSFNNDFNKSNLLDLFGMHIKAHTLT